MASEDTFVVETFRSFWYGDGKELLEDGILTEGIAKGLRRTSDLSLLGAVLCRHP